VKSVLETTRYLTLQNFIKVRTIVQYNNSVICMTQLHFSSCAIDNVDYTDRKSELKTSTVDVCAKVINIGNVNLRQSVFCRCTSMWYRHYEMDIYMRQFASSSRFTFNVSFTSAQSFTTSVENYILDFLQIRLINLL